MCLHSRDAIGVRPYPPSVLVLLWRGLLVLALGALLPSAPALASYKATATSPGSGVPGLIYGQVSGCFGYEFDTRAHLDACITSRAPVGSDVYIQEGFSGYIAQSQNFKRQDGTCFGGSYGTFQGIQTWWRSGAGVGVASDGTVYITGSASMIPYAHGGYRSFIYTNSTCTAAYAANVTMFKMTIAVDPSKAGGNTPPASNEHCEMPAAWAQAFKPRITVPAGSKSFIPPRGAKGEFTVLTVIDFPIHFQPGVTASSPTYPGVLFTKSFDDNPAWVCQMRRNRRIVDFKAGTQIWQFEIWSDPSGSIAAGSLEKLKGEVLKNSEIMGRSDVSNPVVPNGTVPDADGVARAESTWCKSEAASRGDVKSYPNCKDENGGETPVTAAVDWKGQPTGYTHPAPDKLARDNPDCVAKFDPKCAWSSPDAAKPDTKKEDLIRLSENGQVVVRNNPTVYPDTRYPQAMVNAGTAPAPPAPGAQPGDAGNPATTPGDETDDGKDGVESQRKLQACLLTPDKCGGPTGEELTTAAGVGSAVGEGMGQASSMGSNLLSRAIESGKCNGGTDPSYCAGLASIASLSDYPVNRNADFVMSEGDITYANGTRRTHARLTIPAYVMNFLALLNSIVTAWVCLRITIRGKLT